MNKVIIDPSIAAIVDIDSIGINEVVNVYFTAEENWVGDFKLTVFNSNNKNTTTVITNALTIVDKKITWNINPVVQELTAGTKYYEIYSETSKRIVFKGNLNIKK